MNGEFILRIVVAAILGGAIGLERNYRAKEAGFRTHFLVALGSALLMVISQHGVSADMLSRQHISFDPLRIASQVVTGIGFIGAGTIIFQKHIVKGLTTAAGLWVTSAIGLACGSGMYAIAAAATAAVLLCLCCSLCIELVKLIPTGAGLGGGSSDASSVLKAVNDLCRLGLDDSRLEGLASRLGADCAFFIAGRPVYSTGIGDVFTPVGLDLSGYHIVVVKPGVSVPTREAFSQVKPRPSSRRLADDVMLPVSQWRHCITNDFEAGVFALHPEIGQIKDALYASGALYASMSGSGSAVYGIFDSVPDGVADRFAGCFCRVMEM